MKQRRRDIADFINIIFTDLHSGDAFYHPSGADIIRWFNCSREVFWSVIYSVLNDPNDRQLWNETTPVKGRDKQVIRFLKSECRQLKMGTTSKVTSFFEIAIRFQTRYPDSVNEDKFLHSVQVLGGIVQNLAKHSLTAKERAVRKIGLKPVVIKPQKREYKIAHSTQKIIDFAVRSLNDYLRERTDRLPKYEEIGRVVTPNASKTRVQQILSMHLPTEAIIFWALDTGGCWRRIARLLEFASQQADRHFRDNSYHVFSIGRMARQFDLSRSTAARAIQKHLSNERAALWGIESEYKPISMRVHYYIRYLAKVARKHQNNPSWRLPTQKEIGQKLGICQGSVARITHQGLPPELSALWATYKNQPRSLPR